MSDDKVFPILDRKTPVLDRIRNGSGQSGISNTLGRAVGKLVKNDSEEKERKERETFSERFREGLASELGVDVDDISDGFVNSLADQVTSATEEDVLTEQALSDLGIKNAEGDKEEGDLDLA